MKTSELIRRLQEADPSGEEECFVGNEDIYFVTRMPMFYDGHPWQLIHDEAVRDKAWSIVGLKYPARGSFKISIQTLNASEVLGDYPDITIECSEESRPYGEKIRERVKAELAQDGIK